MKINEFCEHAQTTLLSMKFKDIKAFVKCYYNNISEQFIFDAWCTTTQMNSPSANKQTNITIQFFKQIYNFCWELSWIFIFPNNSKNKYISKKKSLLDFINNNLSAIITVKIPIVYWLTEFSNCIERFQRIFFTWNLPSRHANMMVSDRLSYLATLDECEWLIIWLNSINFCEIIIINWMLNKTW